MNLEDNVIKYITIIPGSLELLLRSFPKTILAPNSNMLQSK